LRGMRERTSARLCCLTGLTSHRIRRRCIHNSQGPHTVAPTLHMHTHTNDHLSLPGTLAPPPPHPLIVVPHPSRTLDLRVQGNQSPFTSHIHTHARCPRICPMEHAPHGTHTHIPYMLWHLPHTSPMPTRSLPVADPSSLRDDESSERERRRQGRPMLKACTRHTHGGHTVVEPCAYHVHTPRVRSIEASALLYHVSQGRVEASGHCRAATVTPQASHA